MQFQFPCSTKGNGKRIERLLLFNPIYQMIKSFHNHTTQLNLTPISIRSINDKRKRKVIKIEHRCVQKEPKFRFQLNEKNYWDISNRRKCEEQRKCRRRKRSRSIGVRATNTKKNITHTHTHNRGKMEEWKEKYQSYK